MALITSRRLPKTASLGLLTSTQTQLAQEELGTGNPFINTSLKKACVLIPNILLRHLCLSGHWNREYMWPWYSRRGQERFFIVFHPQAYPEIAKYPEKYHAEGLSVQKADAGNGKLRAILAVHFGTPSLDGQLSKVGSMDLVG